jgi:N-acetylglucosamine-6-phosphate deacetylase
MSYIYCTMIAISNCCFFESGSIRENATILIDDSVITSTTAQDIPTGYRIFDAQGALISPGFLDLQIYGFEGNLFSAYPTVETLRQMDRTLISKGTTGFLACLATNSLEVFYRAIDAAKQYREEAVGFMGLHLEGPYLNPKRLGAHAKEYIRKATLDEVKQLIEYADGTVKMMTIAAELQDDEVIQYLLDQNVVISLGHSDATFEEATAAYNKGIQTTTHLFNAMPSIHHRAPNLPVAVFSHPTAMSSIIADGMHVNFEVVKMAQKVMKDRLFLITDAVSACDIGPYPHRLSDGKFVTADGTLSGSNITLLQAVQNCVRHCDVELSEAFDMASKHPARLMKRTDVGEVAIGKKADLLVLSSELSLQQVFVHGVEQMTRNN